LLVANLAEQNPIHLEATDPELILNSLMLSLSAKKDPEGSQQQELVLWIIANIIKHMEQIQCTILLRLVIQTLERKQLLIQVGTLQSLQNFCGKSATLSTLINEN